MRDYAKLAPSSAGRTALYRHFDAAGGLLYVGISLDTIRRTQQHRSGAHWFGRIARIQIDWHDSRSAALAAEAIAIASEGPAFNIQRPTLTLGCTQRSPPWPSFGDPVRVRGQELHPVLWHGEQWAVTEYGIECRDGTYAIAADRLLKKRIGTNQYDWPLHLREKVWVDMSDFQKSFAVGCWVHHGVPATQHHAERCR